MSLYKVSFLDRGSEETDDFCSHLKRDSSSPLYVPSGPFISFLASRSISSFKVKIKNSASEAQVLA